MGKKIFYILGIISLISSTFAQVNLTAIPQTSISGNASSSTVIGNCTVSFSSTGGGLKCWQGSATSNHGINTAGAGSMASHMPCPLGAGGSCGEYVTECGTTITGIRLEMQGASVSWDNSITVVFTFATPVLGPITFNALDLTEPLYSGDNSAYYQDKISVWATDDLGASILGTNITAVTNGLVAADKTTTTNTLNLVANGISSANKNQAITVGATCQKIKTMTIKYSNQNAPTHAAGGKYGITSYQWIGISNLTTGALAPTASVVDNCGSSNLTATGGGSYSWSNSLGTASTANPSSSGTYTVTVTNGGCTNTVAVTAAPKAFPVVSISIPICNTNSTTVNLVATASSTVSPTYVWSNTGGNINSGGSTLSPNVNSPGSYTLIAYNGAITCSASANVVLTTTGCNLLAIELASITAERNDNTVNVNWETYSETDNSLFEIQRSFDGVNFESIKKIKGSGNSSQKLNYTIIDENPSKGSNYYRLKSIDKNEKATFSKIVSVDPIKSKNTIGTIYPNPTHSELTFDYFSLTNDIMEIEITDYLGRIILQEERKINEGSSNHNIYISELENGIYSIKIKLCQNNYLVNKKIIKN